VILGGLLTATALNMLVLPALYWVFGHRAAVPASDAWSRHLAAVG
jgi:Cu/Ag efflux pump CusA